jgi:hypothetical protein
MNQQKQADAGPFDEVIGAMRDLREKYDDAIEVLSMISDGEFTDPRAAAETLLRNHGLITHPE